MPFHQVTQEDQRRRLAYRVLKEGASIAAAAREFGVSRPTAHLWVDRARKQGIEALTEKSRSPVHSPARTEEVSPELLAAVRECRARHPKWGARKLHALLWPDPQTAPISARTVHRLLGRQGLLKATPPSPPLSDGTQRFERQTCNELWQVDYKGVGLSGLPPPLSVIDDHSRFCVALQPVSVKCGESAWSVLWEAFGVYGLPEYLLCDNGDGFNHTRSQGPTLLQSRLWRLGIGTRHGRARHPQTQGKVERFHRTLSVEVDPCLLGDEYALSAFRHSYNWTRPHEALEMRVPGSVYQASVRQRPERLPDPASFWAVSNAVVRKVDSSGKMCYGGQRYRAGHGLAGEWVELREEGDGSDSPGRSELAMFYAGVRFASLADLGIR